MKIVNVNIVIFEENIKNKCKGILLKAKITDNEEILRVRGMPPFSSKYIKKSEVNNFKLYKVFLLHSENKLIPVFPEEINNIWLCKKQPTM